METTVTYIHLNIAAQRADLPVPMVRRVVRAGLVQPVRVEGRQLYFGDAELARLRRIRRLSLDLGLNFAGIEVAIRLLDRINELQTELNRLNGA